MLLFDRHTFRHSTAPDFKASALMPDKSFKEISLSDYKGKYLVLFFYPLDFTFVCPTEIIAYGDRADEFKNIGCEVLGASVDSKYSHFAWVKTPRNEGGLGEMKIPILADLNRKICQDYGVLLEDGHSLRGTFIIDKRGIIRHVTFNDPPVGRNVSETLRLVQAYQYADEKAEACPCGDFKQH